MGETGRSPWLIVLPVLFVLTGGLGLMILLAFNELAEIQDWDEGTVQTMRVIFEALAVLHLVLFTEWARRIADLAGYGLVGVVVIVLTFVVVGVRMLFVSHGTLSVFVAGAFAVLYALELRRYDIGGRLLSREVSE